MNLLNNDMDDWFRTYFALALDCSGPVICALDYSPLILRSAENMWKYFCMILGRQYAWNPESKTNIDIDGRHAFTLLTHGPHYFTVYVLSNYFRFEEILHEKTHCGLRSKQKIDLLWNVANSIKVCLKG